MPKLETDHSIHSLSQCAVGVRVPPMAYQSWVA
uniref:Uncharacterized protein n=1 Tax=Arundo donax TaxID=35708 RepID=A0A0A8ZTH6_ARUDO